MILNGIQYVHQQQIQVDIKNRKKANETHMIAGKAAMWMSSVVFFGNKPVQKSFILNQFFEKSQDRDMSKNVLLVC